MKKSSSLKALYTKGRAPTEEVEKQARLVAGELFENKNLFNIGRRRNFLLAIFGSIPALALLLLILPKRESDDEIFRKQVEQKVALVLKDPEFVHFDESIPKSADMLVRLGMLQDYDILKKWQV